MSTRNASVGPIADEESSGSKKIFLERACGYGGRVRHFIHFDGINVDPRRTMAASQALATRFPRSTRRLAGGRRVPSTPKAGVEVLGPLVGGVALAGAMGYGMIKALATPPGQSGKGKEDAFVPPSIQESYKEEAEEGKSDPLPWEKPKAMETVLDRAEDKVEEAQEASQEMGAKAQVAAIQTAEAIEEKSEEINLEDSKATAEEKVEDVKDKVESAKLEDVKASAEENVAAAKEQLQQSDAEEIKEDVGKKIEEVKDEAMEQVEGMKEKVTQMAEDVKEASSDAADAGADVPNFFEQLRSKAKEAAAELEAKKAEAAEAARVLKKEQEAARLEAEKERQAEEARLEKEKRKQEAAAKKQQAAEEKKEKNRAMQEARAAQAEARRQAAEEKKERQEAEREARRAAAAEAREATRTSRGRKEVAKTGTGAGTQRGLGTLSGSVRQTVRGGTMSVSGTSVGTMRSKRAQTLPEDASLEELAEAARAAADAAARRAEAAAKSVDGFLPNLLPPLKKAAEDKAERLALEAEELEAEARKLEAQLQGGGLGRRGAIAVASAAALGGIGYVLLQALSSIPQAPRRTAARTSRPKKAPKKESPPPPREIKIDLENPLSAYDALTGQK